MKEEAIENCPEELRAINGGCSLYFHYLYNIYPSEIKDVDVKYLEHIKNFPDPTLKYVALYFYHIYSIAKNFFTKDSNNQNLACNILNRWLDQHRSFFTHAENCYDNNTRWNIHIEPLWEWLQNHFKLNNTCKRHNVFSKSTQIPEGLHPFKCSKLSPEDFICYNPSEDDDFKIKEDCDRLNDLCKACDEYENDPISFALKIESCQTCPSLISTIRFPFTPLGRILSNRGRNKNRFQQQFSEEMEYEEFERYRNNNQRSNNRISHLHYQSMED